MEFYKIIEDELDFVKSNIDEESQVNILNFICKADGEKFEDIAREVSMLSETNLDAPSEDNERVFRPQSAHPF